MPVAVPGPTACVEAALAALFDPAHENCAAVSSGLTGARGAGVATGGRASKPALTLPHHDLRARGSRQQQLYECLAHTCDEEPRHNLKGGNGDAKLGGEAKTIQPAASFSGESGAGRVCRRGCCSYVSSVTG